MENSYGNDANDSKLAFLTERQKLWITILAFIIAIVFGTVGYCVYHPEAGFWNALYHSAQLFVLHSPPFDKPVPWTLEIGRWFAAASTILVCINLGWYILHFEKENYKISHLNKHTILCGLGEIGYAYAMNFPDKKQLLIIESNTNNEYLSKLKKLGVNIYKGNAKDPQVLEKAGIRRAKALYAFTGDDFGNLTVIKNAKELLKTPKIKEDLIELEANIDSLNLKTAIRMENAVCRNNCQLIDNIDQFYNLANQIADPKNLLKKGELQTQLIPVRDFLISYNPEEIPDSGELLQHVKFFDINELSAKYIFRRYPPYRYISIEKDKIQPLKILFLGFSQTGEELLKLCLQNCHFINFNHGNNKVKITLIDSDIKYIENKIYSKQPRNKELIDLEFLPFNPHYLTHDYVNANDLQSVNFIYVCADLDRLQASYSIKAREIFGKEIPIIRWFTKDVISKNDENQNNQDKQNNIHTIDLFSTVTKEEIINNSDFDTKAIANHNKWLVKEIKKYVEKVKNEIDKNQKITKPKPTIAPWLLLDEEIRDDNRSVIEHNLLKIRTTGQLTNQDKDFDHPELAEVDFYFIDKRSKKYDESFLWQLSEMEHRRWMATKYYYGWKHDLVRDDDHKLHPDLTSYDDPKLGSKDYDYQQIMEMKEIWDLGTKKTSL